MKFDRATVIVRSCACSCLCPRGKLSPKVTASQTLFPGNQMQNLRGISLSYGRTRNCSSIQAVVQSVLQCRPLLKIGSSRPVVLKVSWNPDHFLYGFLFLGGGGGGGGVGSIKIKRNILSDLNGVIQKFAH
jgi:hypothetical protein